MCGISGKVEKSVIVKGKYNVSPGDAVTIVMKQSEGYKAVVLSYLIPLVIVISSLVALDSLSASELITGLISISLLAPYFLVLYLFRKKIDRSFTFTLKT
jgi:sigma-E factor negative regulatory protein RseC